MTTAILEIQQLIGVVLDEQGYLFGQAHWLRKIADNVFDVWFFLFL